jgi:hypothetical protein
MQPQLQPALLSSSAMMFHYLFPSSDLAMIRGLDEFLKEHRKVKEQKAIIAKLEQDFTKQQKQIEALAAGLQKVSDQLELSKPALQMVNSK